MKTLVFALALLLVACGGDGDRVLVLDDWQGTEQEWRLEIRDMLNDISETILEDDDVLAVADPVALQEWYRTICFGLLDSDAVLNGATTDGKRAAAIFKEECEQWE